MDLFVCNSCGRGFDSAAEFSAHLVGGCQRIHIPEEMLYQSTEAEDLIACKRCLEVWMIPENLPCKNVEVQGYCPYKFKLKPGY